MLFLDFPGNLLTVVTTSRSAMLNFNLPSCGYRQQNPSSSYSYLKGQVYLQAFTQRKCSEVKLVLDSPISQWQTFPRTLYSSKLHAEHMHHHNTVTRTAHMNSDCRIKVWHAFCAHVQK